MKRIAYMATALTAILCISSYFSKESPSPITAVKLKTPDQVLAGIDQHQLGVEIESFCSRCHDMPSPDLYPAYHWPQEINRALGFHRASGSKIPEPDNQALVAWYQSRAKSRDYRKPSVVPTHPVFTFSEVRASADPTAISSVLVGGQGDQLAIYSTNMLGGSIVKTVGSSHFELCKVGYPSRIRRCDLDAKCSTEFLVSDLGTPAAVDKLAGKIFWLRETSFDGVPTIEKTVLARDLGRVADVKSADFDADGDEDIVIAEFGWDKVGSVVLLENHGGRFERKVVANRHGPVEIEIGDVDEDGREDFVVIFGQEFETVELFVNRGDLEFENRQLYRAPTPAFGISSVELVDVDGDDDLDIAFTSGDMYDSSFTQPHHGLYLLTNNGEDFDVTCLGTQVAAMSCAAGDIDNDGDVDLVVGSFIPEGAALSDSEAYPALKVYTQTESGQFKSSVLKAGNCTHTGIALHDIDGDGDQDLVVGHFHDQSSGDRPAVTLWANTTLSASISDLGSATVGELTLAPAK